MSEALPEPSVRLTPAMLDEIEDEQPLTLLSHTEGEGDE